MVQQVEIGAGYVHVIIKMKKINKTNLLTITLVLLLFIPITYSFSGTKIGSDVYVEGNSPGKLGDKTLSNAQVNIVNTLCEADRYTDRYLFPGNDVDAPGTCKTCDGAGNVGNINGADPHSECNGLSCSSYYYGWVSNTCYKRKDVSANDHICVSGACQTASVCPSQSRGGSSGVSRTQCKTPSGCSGTTAPSLGNVLSGQDTYGDCGTCQACNGVGACAGMSSFWGSNQYGCVGTNKKCTNGACVTCSGWAYNGGCWYEGGLGQSCADVCASKSGCSGGGRETSNCDVCLHFFSPNNGCQDFQSGFGHYAPGVWEDYLRIGTIYYDACIRYSGLYGSCSGNSFLRRVCNCNS
ncbi:MAG: hypothetical protein U9O94_07190 [Nanoarchaeota archaeon]|nr:hypothetical protein [Nanoarchaeota archaeon]